MSHSGIEPENTREIYTKMSELGFEPGEEARVSIIVTERNKEAIFSVRTAIPLDLHARERLVNFMLDSLESVKAEIVVEIGLEENLEQS